MEIESMRYVSLARLDCRSAPWFPSRSLVRNSGQWRTPDDNLYGGGRCLWRAFQRWGPLVVYISQTPVGSWSRSLLMYIAKVTAWLHSHPAASKFGLPW